MAHPILDLQTLDIKADQLQHNLDAIPEAAELKELEEALAEKHAAKKIVFDERHILEREEKRIEDELSSTEEKIKRENGKLFDGTMTGRRELEMLQTEIASLKRRTSELETQGLDLLDQVDPLDATLEGMDAELFDSQEQADSLRGVIATTSADLSGELKAVLAPRSELAASIGPKLLKEYEALRSHRGGVVVSELKGDLCGACMLHLTAMEVERIREMPADLPAHCECGSLLIHS